MNFNEYQKKSRRTAIYPNRGKNFVYPVLGLVGEAGEVAEKIKKIIRDDNSKVTKEKREELKKELGDVLWYMVQIATELKIPLENIARFNLDKLISRFKRGKIHGSGDDR